MSLKGEIGRSEAMALLECSAGNASDDSLSEQAETEQGASDRREKAASFRLRRMGIGLGHHWKQARPSPEKFTLYGGNMVQTGKFRDVKLIILSSELAFPPENDAVIGLAEVDMASFICWRRESDLKLTSELKSGKW